MSTQEADKSIDDLMMAMDIVDTLRRDRLVVQKELTLETKDDQLLERLKSMYGTQGIEVSDEMLKEGIKAMREDRFAYTPTASTLAHKIAKLYVKRDKWLKPTLIVITAILAIIIFINVT